jgi:hypothetical protein
MPLVGLEPTILAFERAKTVNALDREATVIGCINMYSRQSSRNGTLTFIQWEQLNTFFHTVSLCQEKWNKVTCSI